MTQNEFGRTMRRYHGWVAHVDHDDVHELGLQINCPRCEELSIHPDQLDEDIQNRLLRGRIITPLDAIAAKLLRENLPHIFISLELAPSLCGLCARGRSHPVHERP